MTYNYVIKDSTGATYPVTGITEPPDVYAGMLPAGFTILSYTTSGGGSGGTFTYPAYRLIIQSGISGYESGATYPGCTRDTASLCHALSFATIQDAFYYAHQHNEIPVVVQTADEAWVIADAEERARQLQTQYTGPSASPEPPGMPPVNGGGGLVTTIESNMPLILGGLALWFLAKRK